MLRIILLACILSAPLLLSACNTMEGAGQDISNGGHDLSNSAARNK